MNRIDDEAKPFLLPMMAGHGVSLDAQAQAKVANWIALKCMIFENNRREDAATTLEQRQRFMTWREIPKYTQIHLFHCGVAPWDWQFHRHSANATSPAAPVHPRTKNLQSFSIGVGALFVYVFQAFAADIEYGFERVVAKQVWPMTEISLYWPPVMQATADEAERITNNVAVLVEDMNKG